MLSNLKSGDYIGVYASSEGLDVTHVGIAVRHNGSLWFRHASSLTQNRRVVDAPFREYMRQVPGIVVLRAA